MELKEYLRGKNRQKFADQIGVSLSSVNQYCIKQARPSVEVAKKIHEVTHGRVKWLELLDAPKSKQ